jgi:hypothetical protein
LQLCGDRKQLSAHAALKQEPVSITCHASGTGKMTVEGSPRSIRFVLGVDMQHDLRDLAAVGTFRIGIEHAHVGDGVLLIVRGER